MPKQTIDGDAILAAALEMTRKEGYEKVNARSLAAQMKCSVQPIYSYFADMHALKEALYGKAMRFYDAFIAARAGDRGLESMGRANVAFAREETELFRLLFLTKLDGLKSFADIYARMGDSEATRALAATLGTDVEKATEIYVMMIVFTHGIATMLATGGADIPEFETSALLSKAYKAFAGML